MNTHQQEPNWAHTVSNYLLLRRQKTTIAYQSQLINGVDDSISCDTMTQLFRQYGDELFRSLFVVLGQALTKGNTVLVLEVFVNDESKLSAKAERFDSWQLDLILHLLADWRAMLDASSTNVIDELIEKLPIVTDFTSLLSHTVLDTVVEKSLLENLAMAKNMAMFFIAFNQLLHADNSKTSLDRPVNSLQIFYQQLSKLPLCVQQGVLAYQVDNKLTSHGIGELNSTSKDECINSGVNDSKKNLINEGVTGLKKTHKHAPIVLKWLNITNSSSTDSTQANKQQMVMWIHRSWQAEQSILSHIDRLNSSPPTPLILNDLDKKELEDEQINAIDTVNKSAFGIITGGPGTGKTYTVAQLVIAINDANKQVNDIVSKKPNQPNAKQIPLSIVLVAPTGKAAQRMQESLQSALDNANVDMQLQEAKTIHRLLGIGRTGMPRYTAHNRLSEDVIIVDEASMLGIELANYLLSAVKTGSRIILLGDAQQLSAVDAGAVLFDLCNIEALRAVHVNLVKSRRFTDDSAVGKLAKLINEPQHAKTGDNIQNNIETKYLSNAIMALVTEHTELDWFNLGIKANNANSMQRFSKSTIKSVYQSLLTSYERYMVQTQLFSDRVSQTSVILFDELQELMAVFNQFRILTAGHTGMFGDEAINEALTQHHRKLLSLPTSQYAWYHGRPVMVRKNNYALGLFNGDVGICVQTYGANNSDSTNSTNSNITSNSTQSLKNQTTSNQQSGLMVYFDSKDVPIPISRLGNVEVVTAYAMTVHKSQGSEFNHVAVMLEGATQLLSREMLYTAVTRAKAEVSLFGSMDSLVYAITNPTRRITGLAFVG